QRRKRRGGKHFAPNGSAILNTALLIRWSSSTQACRRCLKRPALHSPSFYVSGPRMLRGFVSATSKAIEAWQPWHAICREILVRGQTKKPSDARFASDGFR